MHPNFILGIIAILLIIVGVGLNRAGSPAGFWLWVTAVCLGGIHWIWSIIDVLRHQNKATQSRIIWIILVVIVPAVGSMLYYAMIRPMRL